MKLNDMEKERILDIVRNSRLKPGTFSYAAWFGGGSARKEVDRFYFVGGRVTPFRVYYSNHEFGRSIKASSDLVSSCSRNLPDVEVVAAMIRDIEQRMAGRRDV